MSEFTKHDLLYLLEKIKAACPDSFGSYHSWEEEEEHEMCLVLEQDGLIVRHIAEDGGHFTWGYGR